MINWKKTHTIFGNYEDNVVPNNTTYYTDNEIDGNISDGYFDEVINSLELFRPLIYKYKFKKIDTHLGKDYAMVKTWVGINQDKTKSKIEYWVTNDEGWAIIYSDTHDYLIIGNCNCHPFVSTKDFNFYNSDGSTFENTDYTLFELDDIKELVKIKIEKYIFSQIH